MDPFEKMMDRKRRKTFRTVLAVSISIALFLGAALHVFFCHINQFGLELSLNGSEEFVLEVGELYEEAGASARFSGKYLLKEGIGIDVVSQGQVDSEKIGTYQVRYSATHERWHAEKVRTVRVVDTVAPRIWLVSDPGTYVLPGEKYREEGFMARDNYDGDLTDQVIKTEKNGRIIYSVADSSGNRTEVIRDIVYYDPIAPEIELHGELSISIPLGEQYQEPGFDARDNCDGDLTDRVTVTGSVDVNRAGTYTLHYTVADSYGNETTVERTVHVKTKAAPQQNTVTPSGKVIYLTFDDGPGKYTRELLDVLKKYDVKATFFVVNTRYIDLVKDIVAEGHTIALHTYCHNYKKIYASEDSYFDDLYQMQEIIESKTGIKTMLLRFPGGSSNKVSKFNPGIMTRLTQAVVEDGFRYFDWNVDSNDAGGSKTAEEVFENVINGVQQRRVSIVLQHDTKGYSVDAVEDIILWGLEHGYKFLPLGSDSPTAQHEVNN